MACRNSTSSWLSNDRLHIIKIKQISRQILCVFNASAAHLAQLSKREVFWSAPEHAVAH